MKLINVAEFKDGVGKGMTYKVRDSFNVGEYIKIEESIGIDLITFIKAIDGRKIWYLNSSGKKESCIPSVEKCGDEWNFIVCDIHNHKLYNMYIPVNSYGVYWWFEDYEINEVENEK